MATEQKKPRQQESQQPRNEGEGSRTAARHYNEDLQRFVKQGKVARAAERARRALDSGASEKLKKAEEEGRSHAREIEEDRDYDRQSKLKE